MPTFTRRGEDGTSACRRALRVVARFVALVSLLCVPISSVFGQSAQHELGRARDLAAAGDPARAIEVAGSAIRDLERTMGVDHPQTILALMELARLEVSLDGHERALEIADEAVLRTERGGGRGTAFHGVMLAERAKIAVLRGNLIPAQHDLEASVDILQRELGDADYRTADALRSLAIVRSERGDLNGARSLFDRVVEARRRAPEQRRIALADALLDLAGAETRLDEMTAALEHIAEAEGLVANDNEALAATAKVARSAIALRQSQIEKAEALLHEALAMLNDGPSAQLEQSRARAHYSLGMVHLLQGDAQDGQAEFTEALRLFRKTFGEDHPAVGRALLGIALFYSQQGQTSLALDLLEHAIAIFERSAGSDATPQAEARVEHAFLLRDFGESTRALAELDKAASDLATAGDAAKLRLAFAQSARGFVLTDLRRLDEATQSFELALAGIRQERGDDSSHLLPGLIELSDLYARLGRIDEARAALDHARRLIDRDRAFTPRLHGAALAAEARLAIEAGETDAALSAGERLISFMHERLMGPGGACSANLGEQRAARRLFETVLEVYDRAAERRPSGQLLAAMFVAAQFPHLGETAKTSALTAMRLQSGSAERSSLLRQIQDLTEERCALETSMVGALGGMGTQSEQAPEAIATRLDAISREMDRLESQLAGDDAEPGAFLDPQPVDLEAIAGALDEDEALLLQLTGRDGTHLFFVHAGKLRHARTDLTPVELAEHVEALRAATNLAPGTAFAALPDFPVRSAHQLFLDIFAPFAEDIPSLRNLFFVPDREMRALPPGMLLRTMPQSEPGNFDFEELAKLDYLVRNVAITILPAPDTLVLLRANPSVTRPRRPFLGIGDPVIGPNLPELPKDADRAKDDPSKDRGLQLLRSDGTANPRAFRLMNPLPETRSELASLAQAFGADPEDSVAIGLAANEAWVRNSDALAHARVIAFATHGLVSGEFGELAEPALVLTPPDEPSPGNDGLLTASEITGLTLDADWVLLSACNTAAGRDPRAEGLSGLARAFMHAGARSLMVSHWYVPSDAAAALTVFAARALNADPHGNRAQALRAAMLRVIDGQHPDGRSRPIQAHPLFWAPFVVVGDAN